MYILFYILFDALCNFVDFVLYEVYRIVTLCFVLTICLLIFVVVPVFVIIMFILKKILSVEDTVPPTTLPTTTMRGGGRRKRDVHDYK